MFVFYANVCRLFVFVFFLFFFVCVFVGAIEMHSQLLAGACCVCECFIGLLKVNNLQVVSLGHALVFCLGTCVSFWMFFVVQ